MPPRCPSLASVADFEALRRERDAAFCAANRRNAALAGQIARELGLERLAERFFAEAAGEEPKNPDPQGRKP